MRNPSESTSGGCNVTTTGRSQNEPRDCIESTRRSACKWHTTPNSAPKVHRAPSHRQWRRGVILRYSNRTSTKSINPRLQKVQFHSTCTAFPITDQPILPVACIRPHNRQPRPVVSTLAAACSGVTIITSPSLSSAGWCGTGSNEVDREKERSFLSPGGASGEGFEVEIHR
ncbi:hypothetical protein BC827DRAFT_651729 [Russula dissimulans]|nr:hypothetical protein BC827DRAFT_651729 [Russula dissimulans]